MIFRIGIDIFCFGFLFLFRPLFNLVRKALNLVLARPQISKLKTFPFVNTIENSLNSTNSRNYSSRQTIKMHSIIQALPNSTDSQLSKN